MTTNDTLVARLKAEIMQDITEQEAREEALRQVRHERRKHRIATKVRKVRSSLAALIAPE